MKEGERQREQSRITHEGTSGDVTMVVYNNQPEQQTQLGQGETAGRLYQRLRAAIQRERIAWEAEYKRQDEERRKQEAEIEPVPFRTRGKLKPESEQRTLPPAHPNTGTRW